MDEEMESILALMAELNSFSRAEDNLSDLIDIYDDGELAEYDLAMVSAASSHMSFPELLKKLWRTK